MFFFFFLVQKRKMGKNEISIGIKNHNLTNDTTETTEYEWSFLCMKNFLLFHANKQCQLKHLPKCKA